MSKSDILPYWIIITVIIAVVFIVVYCTIYTIKMSNDMSNFCKENNMRYDYRSNCLEYNGNGLLIKHEIIECNNYFNDKNICFIEDK